MLGNALQVPMVILPIIPLLIISILAFLIIAALLWKRGKTVEALLVWNSLLLYIIALILLLK